MAGQQQGTCVAGDIDRPRAVFPVLTTPTKPRRRALPHPGIDVVASSSVRGGRIRRMFGNLPVLELSDISLLTPRGEKVVTTGGGAPVDDLDLPSGYTDLGR